MSFHFLYDTDDVDNSQVSQLVPVNPVRQVHTKSTEFPAQVPPFKQGLLSQVFIAEIHIHSNYYI